MLQLKSPAKLNLILKVVNKRRDGYHNLYTIFERISLADKIIFRRTENGKIRLSCSYSRLPRGPKNLIVQAARLLQEKYRIKFGADIFLEKHIPVAAGLGGGSSNAATTLLGLNRLWKLNLSIEQLLPLGRRLGSDVPFFLYNCSWAVGTQRGDHIRPLPIGAKLYHILVVPKVRVYTPDIFRRLKFPLTKKRHNVKILPLVLQDNDFAKISCCLSNDLEAAIGESHPNLLKIKEGIQENQSGGVSFSGSGPSIFVVVPTLKEARARVLELKKRYRQVFLVRTF